MSHRGCVIPSWLPSAVSFTQRIERHMHVGLDSPFHMILNTFGRMLPKKMTKIYSMFRSAAACAPPLRGCWSTGCASRPSYSGRVTRGCSSRRPPPKRSRRTFAPSTVASSFARHSDSTRTGKSCLPKSCSTGTLVQKEWKTDQILDFWLHPTTETVPDVSRPSTSPTTPCTPRWTSSFAASSASGSTSRSYTCGSSRWRQTRRWCASGFTPGAT